MKKRVLNVEAVASYLGVSKDTIYKLVREKKIPHFQPPGLRRILFIQELIDEWLVEGIKDEKVT